MAALTVLEFEQALVAGDALETVQELQHRTPIEIVDAALVSWSATKNKPRTEQLTGLAGSGALSGAFWGWLFGLVFFVPLLGPAVRAAMGAISGSMSDVEIDDGFIAEIRSDVTPETSAPFLLTAGAVIDSVTKAMATRDFEIIARNLSAEQEARLREVFEED